MNPVLDRPSPIDPLNCQHSEPEKDEFMRAQKGCPICVFFERDMYAQMVISVREQTARLFREMMEIQDHYIGNKK